MKQIISFDLDGTLVKSGFGDIVWLEGLPKVYAKENNISIEKSKLFFKEEYDNIGSDHREWYDLIFWINKYKLNITPKTLLDCYEHHIELYDDVKPVLNSLKKDFTLIISSGAMQEFIQKESDYVGIKQYFEYAFSSTSDTKTVKKDPFFYKMIANRLNCRPENIIHVGDNLEYDYQSAIKAGLNAFYLNRFEASEESHIVSSLKEFEKKVRKIFKKVP